MGLTASPQRISHLTERPWIGDQGTAVPGLWLADLELGAPKRRRARVRNKAITDRVLHLPIPDAVTGVFETLDGDWTVGDDNEVGFTVAKDLSGPSLTVVPLQLSDSDLFLAGDVELIHDLATPMAFVDVGNINVRGSVYWPLISTDSMNGPFANESPGGLGDNGHVEFSILIDGQDLTSSVWSMGMRVKAGQGTGGGFDPSIYD